MERIEREIQKCINRFEFVFLTYYDSDDGLGLHDIFGILEELLRDDLFRAFKKHPITDIERKK